MGNLWNRVKLPRGWSVTNTMWLPCVVNHCRVPLQGTAGNHGKTWNILSKWGFTVLPSENVCGADVQSYIWRIFNESAPTLIQYMSSRDVCVCVCVFIRPLCVTFWQSGMETSDQRGYSLNCKLQTDNIYIYFLVFSLKKYSIYHQTSHSRITKPPGTFIAGEAA